LASENEYATGIVTDSWTPAGFLVHTRDEDDAREILTQISSSNLDLIFGELEDLGEGKVPERDETIEILSRRFHLLDESLQLPEGKKASEPVAVIFNEDEIQDLNSTPNLSKLTDVALEYMTSLNKPFVLLVESEEMDAASHENDSDRVFK